jgi:hypothetical protein
MWMWKSEGTFRVLSSPPAGTAAHPPIAATFGNQLEDRGRNAGYPAPPAQIRTGPTKASGSYLGYLAARRMANVTFGHSAHAPAPGTRFPGSESGTCFAGPCSPWSPPLAPPPPPPVARLCSAASLLLWRGLTSHACASPALAPRLPGAGQRRRAALVGHEISRFPHKERPHMPGSTTAPGRADTRNSVPARIAFR